MNGRCLLPLLKLCPSTSQSFDPTFAVLVVVGCLWKKRNAYSSMKTPNGGQLSIKQAKPAMEKYKNRVRVESSQIFCLEVPFSASLLSNPKIANVPLHYIIKNSKQAGRIISQQSPIFH